MENQEPKTTQGNNGDEQVLEPFTDEQKLLVMNFGPVDVFTNAGVSENSRGIVGTKRRPLTILKSERLF